MTWWARWHCRFAGLFIAFFFVIIVHGVAFGVLSWHYYKYIRAFCCCFCALLDVAHCGGAFCRVPCHFAQQIWCFVPHFNMLGWARHSSSLGCSRCVAAALLSALLVPVSCLNLLFTAATCHYSQRVCCAYASLLLSHTCIWSVLRAGISTL